LQRPRGLLGGSISAKGKNALDAQVTLWRKIQEAIVPDLVKWAKETNRYLLSIATLIIGWLVCGGLRLLNFPSEVVDVLETCDVDANAVIILMLILTQLRRASAVFLKEWNRHYEE
jgi:hypothetical protein